MEYGTDECICRWTDRGTYTQVCAHHKALGAKVGLRIIEEVED